MKLFKTTFVIALLFFIPLNVSHAQKMYSVHVDYVNPSKINDYNKVAKEFIEACKKYKPQIHWVTTTTSDNRYFYVSSIENFAELDKRPFADMAKSMGDDFGKLFKRFNECYDKHGNYIIVQDEDLSYMPEGSEEAQKGQNHRKYFFLHYTPQNQDKLKDALKGVKDLFVSKGSTEYYRIYHTGFGITDNYYLVAISSKDEIDSATRAKANDELLGDGAKEIFGKVMDATSKFENFSGWMRPDLYYQPTE